MQDWAESAACRGARPGLWFSDDPDDQAKAKAVCSECPVIAPCLQWAVTMNEPDGVWGGATTNARIRARRAHNTGDAAAYTQAISDLIGGATTTTHTGTCQRCGAPIRPGPVPIDTNSTGAHCGTTSTYNRGCRCTPCVEAKSRPIRSGTPRTRTQENHG